MHAEQHEVATTRKLQCLRLFFGCLALLTILATAYTQVSHCYQRCFVYTNCEYTDCEYEYEYKWLTVEVQKSCTDLCDANKSFN